MPTQFPLDSSDYFGKNLLPFLPRLLLAIKSENLNEMDLPKELLNACVTHNGSLTDKFSYIQKLRLLSEEKETKNIQV